jgi:hypothetical protein
MADETKAKESNDLGVSLPDYVTLAAKSVLGVVPFAGSLLNEIAGTIIPNQRLDRIARFAAVLDEKLSRFERSLIRTQLADENFTEIMEEAIGQAARSTTEERRGYIASLIASGLDPSAIGFIETRHLLRILGEVNDAEVIWLRSYLVPFIRGDQEFRHKHAAVLDLPPAPFRAPAEIRDKHALKDGYQHHLAQLGLLEPNYDKDRNGMLILESSTPKLTGYEIAWLGKMLLRYVGLADLSGSGALETQPIPN